MIDTAALARMKRTAILVNVARGGVVVEADLADALRRRVIRGAAMDVYSVEPLPADSELLKLDNIVVTPHLAARPPTPSSRRCAACSTTWRCVSRGEPVPARDLVV